MEPNWIGSEFSFNLTVENIHFSDNDTVKIEMDKNTADFHTSSQNLIW